jgi:SAM-dependent methyltransferase
LAARLTEYASLADVYEFLTPEPLLAPEGNVAAFAPWLPEPPARVLDCACGIGLLAAGLAQAGYDTHASDLSPEMVERTRARGVDARVCDWNDLPPTGDFDAVLCVGNSLAHAEDRHAALSAMAGALRRGGTLVLTSRNWERELAAGTRLEVDPQLIERGGRRALLARAWTIGTPTRLEVAVSLLAGDGSVTAVTEALTVWPFTADELTDDLRNAGLEPQQTTFASETERYLVTASRP